jgi:hypothetical protein
MEVLKMSKIKITRRDALARFNCFAVGYCNLQDLFYCEAPTYYTCGVYGWNADLYRFGDYTIVTGYRPFGASVPYGLTRKYEEAAGNVRHNTNYTYEEKRDLLNILIDEFLQEVKAA